MLRVMENYIFYEPLRKLKETVESGEIGEVSGYHMKMVGSGRGGWDVPASSWEWQFQQMQNGRGILVFDDGWHKLATATLAVRPHQGGAGLGREHRSPPRHRDRCAHHHRVGARQRDPGRVGHHPGADMYLRSDYYTNDERWEVTGRRGYARVNRCTGRGIQQPSLEVYADGEMRSYHALDDDWASSFRDSGRHWLRWLREGEGPLLWSGTRGRRRPAVRPRRLRQQRRRRHRASIPRDPRGVGSWRGVLELSPVGRAGRLRCTAIGAARRSVVFRDADKRSGPIGNRSAEL